MKDYINKFFHEEKGEEGAEFLEYAVIIGLSAILVAVIVVIFMIVKHKALESGKKIDEAGNDTPTVDWDQYIDDNEVNEALQGLGGAEGE